MLEQFLLSEIFAFLMVFARLGSCIMFMPGIGESYVTPRARLVFALAASLVITPIAQPLMPEIPGSPLALTLLLFAEISVGLFLGLLARIMLSAMHTAGMIISMQSGLAAAQMFDMSQGTQGTPFGTFLSLTAIMLLFALNLHHVLLIGVADSYSLFVPGHYPPVGDFMRLAAEILSRAFLIAFIFSAPHIIIGLLTYLASGVMARLMPQMQVFFVIMPAQILISFVILALTLSAGMYMYMGFVENTLTSFFAPGR